MEVNQQRPSVKNLILVTAIAEFFSILILWMTESPIKYPLFIFQTISIVIIYLILSNHNFKFPKGFSLIKQIPQGFVLDVILIYFSSVLILLNIFEIESSARLILAFVSTSFLSGYALLNICNLTKYFSKIEVLVLSHLASFVFSGFLTIILLWTNESLRSDLIASVFIFVGILSAVRHFKNKDAVSLKIKSFSKNIDVLAIILSIIFFLVFFFYVYPNFTLLPGTDISRHYQYSILLSQSPEFYKGFSYILLHAFDSTQNILAGIPSMEIFQTSQVLLNIFLPLAVYVLAKRFFEKVDKRIPAISTFFYSTLTTFAFIYFTQLKLGGLDENLIKTLGKLVGEKAYYSLIYPLQPFAWFGGQSIAIVMLCIGFFLISIKSIPRSWFIAIFTILVLSMYLTHIVESVIFVLFLTIYSLIWKSKSLRIDDALVSSLIAFVFAILIFVYTSIFWESDLRLPEINLILLLAMTFTTSSIIFSLFFRRKIQNKIHIQTKFINNKKFYMILSVTLTVIYLIGFITWFFIDDFSSSSFYRVGVIPWFMYPLMLGIVGLLFLISIRHLGEVFPNSRVAFILAFIPFMILINQTVSFLNVNFLPTGLWEKRLLAYIFLAISLIAPIALVKFFNIQNLKKFIPTIVCSVVIALIVSFGFSSTTLQTQYWYERSNLLPSSDELLAIDYMKNTLKHDQKAFTISPSVLSRAALVLTTPIYQLSQSEIPMSSKNPEVPLFTFSAHNLPHAYIYMHTRDFENLENENSWLVNHMLPMSTVLFSNEEVTIYNASRVSYPLPNSETTMVIPSNPKMMPLNSWFYAYDIISQGNNNYTVMYDKDPNIFASKTVILSYDIMEKNDSLNEVQDYISYVKSGGNLIVFNTNGYGNISNSMFIDTDSLIETDKITTPSGNIIDVKTTLEEKLPTDNVIPLAFYLTSQGKKSILLAEEKIEEGKITFLNIYPLISSFKENRTEGADLYNILGKISDELNFKEKDSVPPTVNNVKIMFKDMNATGNIKVNTTSIIFQDDLQLKKIIITDEYNENIVTNVTKLNIEDYDKAILHSEFISLANGTGLYSKLETENLVISFSNNASVETDSNGEKSLNYYNVSKISIHNDESINMYVRQPTLDVQGNVTLTEPNGKALYSKTRSGAQAIKIFGDFSLTLLMSDTYNFGTHVTVNGLTERVPSLIKDYEIDISLSLLESKLSSVPPFVWFLVGIPFFIAIMFLAYNPKIPNPK